jgi:ABC-2 type transport system permease protein
MIWTAIKLSYRIKIAFFLTFVMPTGFFFIYCGLFAHGQPARVAAVMQPLVSLLVIGTAVFAVGGNLAVMRERDILRRYHLAPISPLKMILTNIMTSYILSVPVVAVQFLLAKLIYHAPLYASALDLWIVFSLGFVALGGIGMVAAGLVNTMQEAQILNQILFLVLLFLSGTTIPLAHLPLLTQRIALFLPATLMIIAGQGLMLAHHALYQHLPELLGMATTAFASVTFAIGMFRWEREEKASRHARVAAALALIPMLLVGVWLNLSTNFQRTNKYLLHPDPKNDEAPAILKGSILPILQFDRHTGWAVTSVPCIVSAQGRADGPITVASSPLVRRQRPSPRRAARLLCAYGRAWPEFTREIGAVYVPDVEGIR